MNLRYRDATLQDLPLIVDIYNSTIASRIVTADTELVSIESKLGWFNEHNPEKRPLWIVINNQEQVVGWISFQDFYGRPAYNGTAEISIYIAEWERGKGLGKEMLLYCIEKAPSLGISTLVGFIFSHNLPSIQLFESCGFKEWAMLPDIANLDGVNRSLKIYGLRVSLNKFL